MLEVLSARTDFCFISDAPRVPRKSKCVADRHGSHRGSDSTLAMTPQPDAVRKKPYKDSASHDLSQETDDSSQAELMQQPSKYRQDIHPAAF